MKIYEVNFMMNIQEIIDAIKTSDKEVTLRYFEVVINGVGRDAPSAPSASGTSPSASGKASDSEPRRATSPSSEPKCEDCGKLFRPFTWKGNDYSAETAYSWALNRNGRAICLSCVRKRE